MSDHIKAADYIRGGMDAAEREAAAAHLETCATCRAAVEAARRVAGEETTARASGSLLGLILQMLEGSATLLSPPLRRLGGKGLPEPVEQPKLELPRFEPLRVLQPRVFSRARRFFGRMGVVIALTILTLLIPVPEGLSPEGHRALAVFVFTGSILALEPVSLPIAALMVPVATVALNVGTAPQAFETFSRPVVFLILSSLFMAEALRKHGLTRRVALGILVASGGGVRMLLLGMMGIAAGFSMWVENTATAAMLIPVALTVAKQVPDPKKAKPLLSLLVLGIAYAASLGGMATVMGSSSNAVASGFLARLGAWSFLDWMKFGLPAFLITFPVTWWVLMRLVPVEVSELDVEGVRKQVEKLGPMTSQEKEILLTLGVAIVFWVGGSFIEPALGLPPTLLSSAMIAVITVGYLSVRNIINWEDVKGVSWGIFLTIGAGLSLGETLSRTGATDWFAELIQPVVKGPPLIVSLLLLVFVSALLTNLLNNTTIAAVFVPILISIAEADPNFNALQLVLPVTLATTFGYSLPSASGRMALVAASGLVDRTVMMRNGVILTVISSVILGLFFYLLAVLGWI